MKFTYVTVVAQKHLVGVYSLVIILVDNYKFACENVLNINNIIMPVPNYDCYVVLYLHQCLQRVMTSQCPILFK